MVIHPTARKELQIQLSPDTCARIARHDQILWGGAIMFLSPRHLPSWALNTLLVTFCVVFGSSSLASKRSRIVSETNSAPVAVDDSFTVHGQRQLTPLTNDYDPDNDPFSLYTFTQPQHGSILTGTS